MGIVTDVLRRDIEWRRVETLDIASRLSPQDQPFKYSIGELERTIVPELPLPLHPIQIKLSFHPSNGPGSNLASEIGTGTEF